MSGATLLAIETSQREGGVAACSGPSIESEPLRPQRRHDDDLFPAIDRLCSRMGLSPSSFEAIAVSCGPGGFSGLRIGLAAAKTMTDALGIRLLLVPTAHAVIHAVGLSENLGCDPQPVTVVLAVKGEELWCSSFRRERATQPSDEWQPWGDAGLQAAANVPLDDLRALIADRFLPQSLRARAEEAGVPILQSRFDPRASLEIGRRMLKAGQTIDPLAAGPLYARGPEAVRLFEARQRPQ